MAKVKEQSIVININNHEFEKGRDFVESILNNSEISDFISSATMMVFEALYHDIQEQGCAKNGEITIRTERNMGEIRILLGFDGSMFIPPNGNSDELTPEGRIITSFADRIGYTYYVGFNAISITVKRKHSASMYFCAIAIALALCVYFPFHMFLSTETQSLISNNLLLPFETLFGNAVLMIGAPVSFFSLLKNITDVYITAARTSGIREIRHKTLVSSITSIILALITAMGLKQLVGTAFVRFIGNTSINFNVSWIKVLSSLIPSNIFEPFITINPFPLILLAVIMTYSLCSQGQYFSGIKKAIDACYSLFAKMLIPVMYLLPIAAFTATLHLLMKRGYMMIGYIIVLIILILICSLVLLLYYAIKLRFAGVEVIDFGKKLKGMIKENYIINSAIDAVPYNTRYCVRHLKMNRKKLEKYLPVLAQINLDGNCFMIALISILLVLLSGTKTNWLPFFSIGCLTLFLSLGAPNQPGSIMVGLTIMLTCLKLNTFLPVAIYCEVFFGGILNLLNIIGDIVLVKLELINEEKHPL